MTESLSAADQKKLLRSEARLNLAKVDFNRAAENLWKNLYSFSNWKLSNNVLFYETLPCEFPSDLLIREAFDEGKHIFFPSQSQLAYDQLLQIDPPIKSVQLQFDFSIFDLVVIPGLCFDRKGYRLGRGGGYYDRVLGKFRKDCLTVGVIPQIMLKDSLEGLLEPWDLPVKYLLTESGLNICPVN
ncbi:MAG: 5-formyltetrahydrofolate cyclo-ligase [Candidatus Caenarcaniphilales bacterium]|nr:5-formyltetrahydrofolate cyclo-ligase [Candidatus Caenarcaniphilales bacterium]